MANVHDSEAATGWVETHSTVLVMARAETGLREVLDLADVCHSEPVVDSDSAILLAAVYGPGDMQSSNDCDLAIRSETGPDARNGHHVIAEVWFQHVPDIHSAALLLS